MQFSPICTLCPICTRLSIFVPDADDGRAGDRAIDRRARADLDAIADDDVADLRDLHVLLADADETEAVAADDAAGVEDAIVADDAMIEHDRARMHERALADRRVRADVGAGGEDRTVADRRALLDDRVRADPDNSRRDAIAATTAVACAEFTRRKRWCEEAEHRRQRGSHVRGEQQRLVAAVDAARAPAR